MTVGTGTRFGWGVQGPGKLSEVRIVDDYSHPRIQSCMKKSPLNFILRVLVVGR